MEPPKSIYLITDRKYICQVPKVNSAPFLHTLRFSNFLTFLEVHLLQFPATNTTNTVKRMLSGLSQHHGD